MTIRVLGVPTSAGSHHCGQEQAPRRLRQAGLVSGLRQRGIPVIDEGDLPMERYRSMGIGTAARDLDRVIAVVRATAVRMGEILRRGDIPLVLGGDCTVTIGAVAAIVAQEPDAGLVYFDGDADLNTPGSGSGVLDATVLTHLLGRGSEALAHAGTRCPLLDEGHVVLVEFHPSELSVDDDAWPKASDVLTFPATTIGRDHVRTARTAVAALRRRAGRYLVHFDVDVIDSGDLALANFPHFNGGLSATEAFDCLRVFIATAGFAGLVVTEVNPGHDPDGDLLADFAASLGEVLASAAATWHDTPPGGVSPHGNGGRGGT